MSVTCQAAFALKAAIVVCLVAYNNCSLLVINFGTFVLKLPTRHINKQRCLGARVFLRTCFCISGCASSSGMKSRQMCMEGTPETIMGSSCRG